MLSPMISSSSRCAVCLSSPLGSDRHGPQTNYTFSCKYCNRDTCVDSFVYKKASWIEGIRSAMMHQMWMTQQRLFKVAEIKDFLVDNHSLCYGRTPEEIEKADLAPYFTKKVHRPPVDIYFVKYPTTHLRAVDREGPS